MPWNGLTGHDDIVEQFRRAVLRQRLASSFLFAGPPGIGKRTFAIKLAQVLLCRNHSDTTFDPCMHCTACTLVGAGTHPDLTYVAKPNDKSLLPLELLIGDEDHRMRAGLVYEINLKPSMGGWKIGIIDDADYFNQECANSLLKTLEEPPPRSVLILIGTSPTKQLPTIRSRCQVISFKPLSEAIVAELLLSKGLVSDVTEAKRLAHYSDGSLERAQQLSDSEIWTFRGILYRQLTEGVFDSVAFASKVSQFVDTAGKEPRLRRQRFHHVVQFAIDFYRHLLRAQSGATGATDAELHQLLEAAVRRGNVSAETTANRLERCLETDLQIDRNVNITTLIEAWLDGLVAEK